MSNYSISSPQFPQSPVDTPKKQANNAVASPFTNFCIKDLTPLRAAARIPSPTPSFGYILLRNLTPDPWDSISSPSFFKISQLSDYDTRVKNQRYVQKLDFSNLPAQFKASLVQVHVNITQADDQPDSPPVQLPVKRKRQEQAKSTQKCNCAKSKCLKLYCDCFSIGQLCDGCNCKGCFNTVENERARQEAMSQILERNPLAFQPKFEVDEQELKHQKGCNCKRSACLKKYCECFQMGAKCIDLCKCVNCKNICD